MSAPGHRNLIFPQRPTAAAARALAGPTAATPSAGEATATATVKPQATETIARRTGAMVNEVDFPGFVAQLVHGTFDAIVDASIRQMESYSSMVAAVSKTVDQFTEDNVSLNQARDWLATHYPGDIVLLLPDGGARTVPELVPRTTGSQPLWLADYGLADEELTAELLEQRVLPQVRLKVGSERQQLLATMVLLGMNRVVVRDGSISSKVMFRAAAQDVAKVGYATGSDPAQADNWGERGSSSYAGQTSTMVSTLQVNAQNESNVRADLFGEVKLNFVSETLPLERLADAAKVALVQRNAPAMRAAAGNLVPAAAAPAASSPAEGAA
ncbi:MULTISPECIES: hypothetical protein [Xanthomonas]|uniref:hypothetical protein n=1 Tax=Xanthomonas TaxID=338 RepID=UPI0006F24BA4|nr:MULTISPECIES: hypothetical protein [Xanthomonas]KQR13084.1 hypothetical protein ASF90_07635 [Xanthomonas sp. Leaf148]